MNEIDAAWLAGLFEGEGSVQFTGANSVNVVIAMTDFDVIEKARRVAGGIGNLYEQARPNRKDQLRWVVGKKDEVVPLLEAMLPHLGQRRSARVKAALDRLEGCRDEGFCKRGHALVEGNLYVAPDGSRTCRTCARWRERVRTKKRYPSGRPGRHPKACDCPIHIIKT